MCTGCSPLRISVTWCAAPSKMAGLFIATTTMSAGVDPDKKRMDILCSRMYRKLVCLIDDSRSNASVSPTSGDSLRRSLSRPPSLPDKWASPSATSRLLSPWSLTLVVIIPQFNLECPKSTLFQDDLVRFQSISSSALPVDQFELQVVLHVPKLQEGSALVYCLPESPGLAVEVTDPPDVIPLESWTISFSQHGDEERSDYGTSRAYKQGISIFRAAYTLLRWLPTWKLRNYLQRRISSGELEGLRIELRGRFHPAAYADGCEGKVRSRCTHSNTLTLIYLRDGYVCS